MNLKPSFGRVIIRPEAEHTSKRLIIPEAFKKHANLGEVLAVGPGRRHINGEVYPPPFKVGDRVMFDRARAFQFEFDGDAVVMVDDDGVLAVLPAAVDGN